MIIMSVLSIAFDGHTLFSEEPRLKILLASEENVLRNVLFNVSEITSYCYYFDYSNGAQL